MWSKPQVWKICAAEGDGAGALAGCAGLAPNGISGHGGVSHGYLDAEQLLPVVLQLRNFHGPKLGWELSQHIQEKQRVYLAPSSDLKGFVEFGKKPSWMSKTPLAFWCSRNEFLNS